MKKALLAFVAALLLAGPAAAVTIEDSRGTHEFAAPPRRVVALTWSTAEQILELGIVPVGIADIEGYEAWVVRPPIPEGVASVGLRHEPNMERIAELKPDLILASDDQIAFVPQLETIAPVLHFNLFNSDQDVLATSRRVYLDLGRLFGREDHARARLDELDRRLEELAGRIRDRYGDNPPKVTIVRFVDEARLVVHGENAMPIYALNALGLESGYPQPASKWGVAFKKVQDLGRVNEGIVLHIEPFPQAEKVFANPLWQAMPFVRAGRFGSIRSTWSYGGALSVGYLAEAITEALLAVDPE